MNMPSTTSEDILRVARSLVIAGGYNGFSYADIAAVVGIRKASIHHHFPSKVDLVRTLVVRYREEARAGLTALARHAAGPPAQLRAYTGYWAACISDNSAPFCACALLAGEIPVLPEAVAQEVRLHFQALAAWLADVLARGARDGTLRFDNSPAVEAETLVALVHGAMLSARAHGDARLFATILEPTLDRLIV